MKNASSVKTASILTSILYLLLGILAFVFYVPNKDFKENPIKLVISYTPYMESITNQKVEENDIEHKQIKSSFIPFSEEIIDSGNQQEASIEPQKTVNISSFSETTSIAQTAFLRELDSKIRASLVYPKRAQKRNIEGLVTLFISITEEGRLLSAEVTETSGSTILDDAAIRLIESLFPLTSSLTAAFETKISISYLLK